MHITPGDFEDKRVVGLLRAHHQAMQAHSPPEACHVLDIDALRAPQISFWTIWEGEALVGCGALKQLSADHGEIKSMRTAAAHLRKGAGAAMLNHIVSEARARGIRRLSLETGTGPEFEAALALYRNSGFTDGAPFGGYPPTDFTRFLHRDL